MVSLQLGAFSKVLSRHFSMAQKNKKLEEFARTDRLHQVSVKGLQQLNPRLEQQEVLQGHIEVNQQSDVGEPETGVTWKD